MDSRELFTDFYFIALKFFVFLLKFLQTTRINSNFQFVEIYVPIYSNSRDSSLQYLQLIDDLFPFSREQLVTRSPLTSVS